LGQEFLTSIEAAFDAMARRPILWRRLKGRFHAASSTDSRMGSSMQSRTMLCMLLR